MGQIEDKIGSGEMSTGLFKPMKLYKLLIKTLITTEP